MPAESESIGRDAPGRDESCQCRDCRHHDWEHRAVRIVPDGPILVEGPVELVHDEGIVRSDRFIVAVCTCRRSNTYPLCDTSHRRRTRGRRDMGA
ncbi:CDGSH iron-sulfur domain-containing protein [Actinopolymorpha sp. B9G3]|uniref:CDGSH iron-sulfur domain-containing protein n=1 Tax=Actinopolymorpha sp. B9G3 TaxID=3158970 RepID=UPI0032D9089F